MLLAAVAGFDSLTFDLKLAVTLSYLTISQKHILVLFSETKMVWLTILEQVRWWFVYRCSPLSVITVILDLDFGYIFIVKQFMK